MYSHEHWVDQYHHVIGHVPSQKREFGKVSVYSVHGAYVDSIQCIIHPPSCGKTCDFSQPYCLSRNLREFRSGFIDTSNSLKKCRETHHTAPAHVSWTLVYTKINIIMVKRDGNKSLGSFCQFSRWSIDDRLLYTMYINYTPSSDKTCDSRQTTFHVDRLVSNSWLGKILKWIKGEEAQGGGGARGSFT